MSPLGGSERKLFVVPETIMITGMSWSPDSKWLAVTTGNIAQRELCLIGISEGSHRRFPLPGAMDVAILPRRRHDSVHTMCGCPEL